MDWNLYISWGNCMLLSQWIVGALGVVSVLVLFLRNANRNLCKLGVKFALYLSFIALFLAGAVLYLPAYWHYFDGSAQRLTQSVLMACYQALCLFIIDSNIDFLLESAASFAEPLSEQYHTWAGIMILLAPVPTFGFIFSLFKNTISLLRYRLGHYKNAHVFSALNLRTLALAQSLREAKKGELIIFADVDDAIEADLQEEAHALNAIFFSKEISALPLGFHGKFGAISYYIFGDDESENLVQSLALIKKNKRKKYTTLYLLSNSAESKLLFSTISKSGMNLHRISESTSLIYRSLYDTGRKLFQNENLRCDADGIKHIYATIIGMGGYGTEMVKALAWVGQMDGYRIHINAFDSDPHAKTRFTVACPELMHPDYNHQNIKGEAAYDIDLYPGVDVDSQEFRDQLAELGKPTFVFVALGADAQNVQVATDLRSYFLRLGWGKPIMQAVVYCRTKETDLTNSKNYRRQAFEIDYLGDLQTSFSQAVVVNSELERDALSRHMQYATSEEDFWKYEYNYKSSMASALHVKLQAECGMPGVTKTQQARTMDEINALSKLEHRRWNAYMRAEGYSYSAQRNDLAKQHPDLIPFDDLDAGEQKKDIIYMVAPKRRPAEDALVGKPLLVRCWIRIYTGMVLFSFCSWLCSCERVICFCQWLSGQLCFHRLCLRQCQKTEFIQRWRQCKKWGWMIDFSTWLFSKERFKGFLKGLEDEIWFVACKENYKRTKMKLAQQEKAVAQAENKTV